MRKQSIRRAVGGVLALACILALGLSTFAFPVESWRTGEAIETEFPVSPSGAETPQRIWIDTDPACGHGPRSDPDDCFAIHELVTSGSFEIVGISSVFGNAGIDVTDQIARELAEKLSESGHRLPSIDRGAASPVDGVTPASSSIAKALAAGRLTILALGPLTNIASVLKVDPDLSARVEAVVAVMGQRPGHLFHPSEGRGDGVLFGHGPVFSDFNFRKDAEAARLLLSADVPVTLIPYEVAREVLATPEDLDRIAASGPAGEWIANGAKGWLDFWHSKVGLDGFYPFDLVAARYILNPNDFLCGPGVAHVDKGWAPNWFWLIDDAGLFVEPSASASPGSAVTYCPKLRGS